MQKKNQLGTPISLRLPEECAKAIEELAIRDGMNKSEVARIAIINYLRANGFDVEDETIPHGRWLRQQQNKNNNQTGEQK